MNKRQLGGSYEKIAGEFLIAKGYEIIEYNFFCKIGEIDIIAKCDEYICFVEVKYRKNKNAGMPIEAVTFSKQRKISKTAMYYCLTHNINENQSVRFDVVGILGNEIVLYENAFEYCE